MTNKKAIRVLEHIEYYLKTHTNESCEEEHTALDLAIKALEEKTQGDLISREDLKKRLNEMFDTVEVVLFDDIIATIDNAPTVELNESVIQEVLNKRCMTAVTNEYLIALHGKRPQGGAENG